MPFPRPAAGQVIRYSYLWRSEYQRGQEEGSKDRPCVIVLAVTDEEGDQVVTVLPVTHTPPAYAHLAVEIPHLTKQRLGLDDARSWVVLTEANRFTWPGPDLCMRDRADPDSVVYGELPRKLLVQIKERFLAAHTAGASSLLTRTQ